MTVDPKGTRTPWALLRHPLCIGLLAALVVLVANFPVQAKQPTPAESMAPRQYTITAGQLGDALNQLAAQSHMQIVYAPELVQGKTASAVNGRLTWRQVLEKLLAGTGLEWRIVGHNLVAIRKTAPSPSFRDERKSAQQEKSPSEVTTLDQINVTGTHIAGVGSSPTLPEITITHEQIVERGYSSLSDLLRSVSMNFSNMSSSSYVNPNSGAPRFSSGLTAINLRGLGTGATLVLIDGHRTANAPTEDGTMVDISKIPIAMVERVEIITGPAAAIYGSDAVAGVVNIITRKNYRGSQTFVGYGNSSSDANSREVRQLFGFGWGSGNLTMSIDGKKDNGAKLSALGITSEDQRSRGGRDYRNFTYSDPGQLVNDPYSPEGSITIPGAPPDTSSALLPAGNGQNVHVGDLVYVSDEDQLLQKGNYLMIHPSNSNLEGYLTPETKNISGQLNLTQRINSAIDLSLGLTYSNRRSVTNTYGFEASEIVPASNAYNHFGQPVEVYFDWGSVLGQTFALPTTNSSINTGVDATLSFKLPWRDWTGNLTLSDSRAAENDVQTSLVSQYFASGTSENPTAYGALVAALSSSDPAHALDLFSSDSAQPGGFTPSDFTYQRILGDTISASRSVNGDVTGTVFSLPTGPVKLAVGMEVRKDSLDFRQYELDNFTMQPSRMLHGFYGELFVPLMREAAGGRQPLILQIADRYDGYSINGPFANDGSTVTKRFSASSPQIGLRWQPSRDWTVKANWGKAYQTPTIQDLFDAFVVFPSTIFDPANPASNGGPKTVPFLFEGGGNPNLQPQTSKSRTLSVTYRPEAFPGLITTLDWSEIHVTNLVTAGITGNSLVEILQNPSLNPGVVRNASGVLQALNFSSVNAAVQNSKAFDFRTFYDFYTRLGYFEAGVSGTYTTELSEQITAQAPVVYSQGRVIGPSKWHVIPSLIWHRDGWSANVFLNYYSGVINTDPASPQRRIKSISTVDTQVGWHSGDDQLQVLLGAHNLFDKKPPFYDTPYGIDFSRYNAAGREVYLHVIFSFGRNPE